ncbi:MAG: WG repeat-containing protein [Bacteroidota bacterium]
MVFNLVLSVNTGNALAQTENFRIPYRSGTKWGYADLKAKLVIPAIYDSVGIPLQKNSSSLQVFYRKNGTMKAGIIDYSGNMIVAPEYDAITYHSYGILTYGTINYLTDDNGKVVDSLQSLLNAKGKTLIGEGPFVIKRKSRLKLYLLIYNDEDKGAKAVVFDSEESKIIQELAFAGKGVTYVNDHDEMVWEKENGEVFYYKKSISGEFVIHKKQRNAHVKGRTQIIEEVRPTETDPSETGAYGIGVSFDGSYAHIDAIPENTPDSRQAIESIPLTTALTKTVTLYPPIEKYKQFNVGGIYVRRAVRYKEWYYEYMAEHGKYVLLFPWKKQIFEIAAERISENIIHNSVGILVKVKRENKWHVFLTGKGTVNEEGFDEIVFMAPEDQIVSTNNLYHSVFIFKKNGKYNLMNKSGKILLSKGYDRITFATKYFRLIDADKVDFYIRWKEIPAKLSLEHFAKNELKSIYGEQKGYHRFGQVFKKEGASQAKTFCGFISLDGIKFFED